MRNIDKEFYDALAQMEEKLERLIEVSKERDFPEDLNNPTSSADSTDVTCFANRVHDLGGDIAELGEKMMLGAEVKRQWEEREENCYADIEEKRNDHGVFQRNF